MMKTCEIHSRTSCGCHTSNLMDLANHRMCGHFVTTGFVDAEDPVQNSEREDQKEAPTTPEKKTNITAYNPFDLEIESLSMPSCSPSVFQITATSEDDDNKPFSWSIDQIAILAPVDIDESSHQDTYQELDFELEQKAQKAIETFFSHNSIVPSPWGMTAKQVIFSPNLASAVCNAKLKKSANNAGIKCQSREVWTQTVLSIPPMVDILELLGKYCSFHGDQYLQKAEEGDDFEMRDSLSTSLRRKLFTVDKNSPTPRRNTNQIRAKSPSMSPMLQYKTPEKQMTLFLTPGSAQFASSPISSNCSMSSNIPVQSMCSPPISPISKSDIKTPTTSAVTENVSPQRLPMPSIASRQEPSNLKESPINVNLSLSMLSTSNGEEQDCTQEMGSQVSADMARNLLEPPSLPTISQDTGYQTRSYQSAASCETLSMLLSSTNSNRHADAQKSWPTNEDKFASYTIAGNNRLVGCVTTDSQFDASSMDIDSLTQRHSEPLTNSDAHSHDSMIILQSGWKPSVCSTPHL